MAAERSESVIRDVVVLGASAGGVEALRSVVAGLRPDLPAAVLTVLHVPRSGPSVLPRILSRAGPLPAAHAVDGEPLICGRVYVAPNDHHLILSEGQLRLSTGPTENGHRPAVDSLFRSAAAVYGSRVIGGVLSGALDDGAAGLAAIAQRGGVTLVQDPSDALQPGMPLAAMEYIAPDHVLTAAGMGPLIADLAGTEPAPAEPEPDATLDMENAMAAARPTTAEHLRGRPAGFGCPSCGGSLWEVAGTTVPHFRCRVGHAWSPRTLLDQQHGQLDDALWIALRALEEKAALAGRMSRTSVERGNRRTAQWHRRTADEAERAAAMIRTLIKRLGSGAATGEAEAEAEAEAAEPAVR